MARAPAVAMETGLPSKVLIVEDEQNIAESLRFVLEREGFEVASVSDGARALDALAEARPDVVVLDAMLPGLDGFEVLHRLRREARYAKLPVLMLTARAQKRDRAQAETDGVDIFMTKPFANADVVAAVKRLAS